MRTQLGFLALVAAAALIFFASSAATSNTSVRLRISQPVVDAGATIGAAVGVSPAGVACHGTFGRAGGSRYALKSKRAVGGHASWVLSIAKSGPAGRWTVSVACGTAGSAQTSFLVRALPVTPAPPAVIPAKVVLEKTGVSSRASSIGSTFADYGLVLHNLSPDQDALDVSVLVNVLDASGAILGSDNVRVNDIPAGATFYAGGDVDYNGSAPAASIEATVQVGDHQPKKIGGLPPVSNLRWSDGFSGAEVAGEFSNPYTQPLSSLAEIGVVCFDSAGNVIGGTYTFPPAEVPPGGRAGFSAEIDGLSAARIASCQASVEPEAA